MQHHATIIFSTAQVSPWTISVVYVRKQNVCLSPSVLTMLFRPLPQHSLLLTVAVKITVRTAFCSCLVRLHDSNPLISIAKSSW